MDFDFMFQLPFETVSMYLVAIINIVTAGRFVYLIKKGRIKPALAMWLFFLLAIATSLITYIKDADYSVLNNILNTTDLFLAVSVTVAILLYGDKSSRFNRFDLTCLGLVMMILIFWFFTGAHFITNLLIQAILVIAYFPVLQRMVTLKMNTESFTGWIGMLLAAIVSLFSLKGTLAMVYSYRAIICITLLLLIMIYFEIKAKNRLKVLQ
ncbi:MAG: hypothetical protein WCQ70_10370 [Lentimicrobiaceae bacterium]